MIKLKWIFLNLQWEMMSSQSELLSTNWEINDTNSNNQSWRERGRGVWFKWSEITMKAFRCYVFCLATADFNSVAYRWTPSASYMDGNSQPAVSFFFQALRCSLTVVCRGLHRLLLTSTEVPHPLLLLLCLHSPSAHIVWNPEYVFTTVILQDIQRYVPNITTVSLLTKLIHFSYQLSYIPHDEPKKKNTQLYSL